MAQGSSKRCTPSADPPSTRQQRVWWARQVPEAGAGQFVAYASQVMNMNRPMMAASNSTAHRNAMIEEFRSL